MTTDRIIQYRSIAIATSWACDATCRHCFIPRTIRSRSVCDERMIRTVIRGLPDWIRVVSFTGGEAFLDPGRFLRLLQCTRDTGRASTVVTNGLWSRRAHHLDRILDRAHQKGLRGLAVSFDAYHHPAITVEEVSTLARACNRANILVKVRGVGARSQSMLRAVLKKKKAGIQIERDGAYDLDNVGEALVLPPDRLKKPRGAPCETVLSPLLTPEGRLMACCSSRIFHMARWPLVLGDVRREAIGDILERSSRDLLLAGILVLGPDRLARMAGKDKDWGAGMFQCERCVSLMNDEATTTVLLEKLEARKKEIVARVMLYEKTVRRKLARQLLL
ncbi:MAG: radical SAM protein [Myxococcales bacterium]|nr:radical SAM protein [Myxococcales bacterium]